MTTVSRKNTRKDQHTDTRNGLGGSSQDGRSCRIRVADIGSGVDSEPMVCWVLYHQQAGSGRVKIENRLDEM